MNKPKQHYPHADYRGEYLSRRDLLKRALLLGGAGAAGLYLEIGRASCRERVFITV